MQYIQNIISQINFNLSPIKKVFKTLKHVTKNQRQNFIFHYLKIKSQTHSGS